MLLYSRMNDFGLLLVCLCRACKFASRVTLGGSSNFKLRGYNFKSKCFGTVHLLLLNVQWDLDWELRILNWPPKSAQIGKNDIQFPANFLRILQFKQTRLFECLRLIHKYALSLLFHLKSWFAEKLNYATAFARVYKQYLPWNVNITFAVIKKNR